LHLEIRLFGLYFDLKSLRVVGDLEAVDRCKQRFRVGYEKTKEMENGEKVFLGVGEVDKSAF